MNSNGRKKRVNKDQWSTVKFVSDKVVYICRKKDIVRKNQKISAKWLDGKYYECEILESGCYAVLEKNREKHTITDQWSTVRFVSDKVVYICRKKDIVKKNQKISAKWLDGKYYECEILESGCYAVLEKNREKHTKTGINIINFEINLDKKGAKEQKSTDQTKCLRKKTNFDTGVNSNNKDSKSETSANVHQIETSSKKDQIQDVANETNSISTNIVPNHENSIFENESDLRENETRSKAKDDDQNDVDQNIIECGNCSPLTNTSRNVLNEDQMECESNETNLITSLSIFENYLNTRNHETGFEKKGQRGVDKNDVNKINSVLCCNLQNSNLKSPTVYDLYNIDNVDSELNEINLQKPNAVQVDDAFPDTAEDVVLTMLENIDPQFHDFVQETGNIDFKTFTESDNPTVNEFICQNISGPESVADQSNSDYSSSSESWRDSDEEPVLMTNKKTSDKFEQRKKLKKRFPGLYKGSAVSDSDNIDSDISDRDNKVSDISDSDNDKLTSKNNCSKKVQKCASPKESKCKSSIAKKPSKNAKNKPQGDSKKSSNEALYHVTVNKMSPTKARWKKKYPCKYCEGSFAKLLRHIIKKHKQLNEVIILKALPKDSAEKQKMYEKIRADGQLRHNRQVVANGSGELKTKRRATDESAPEEYVTCVGCHLMIKKTYLCRHRKSCKKIGVGNSKTSRAEGELLLQTIPCSVDEMFRKDILNRMKLDTTYNVIINDKLILQLGQQFYKKSGKRSQQKDYISCKMREIAKFLIAMRQISDCPHRSLKGCLKARNMDQIIEAVHLVGKFNPQTMRFAVPSIALKIGHSINKCCAILSTEAVQNDDLDEERKIEAFKKALNQRWPIECSHAALKSLNDIKFNRIQAFPLAEDIKKFNDYLLSEISSCIDDINEDPTPDKLILLSKLLMCLIVVFNRRRAGEVQRMLFKHVVVKSGSEIINNDIFKQLSPLEKKLATTLSRFEIIGKRYRRVPILLNPLMAQGIEILKTYRNVMGIHPENPHFFALPESKDTTLQACSEIAKFAKESGAQNHAYIRSTVLRKHFASMLQLYNLSENNMDVIADFLGHDIRVHRQFYRLPQSTLQLVQMGKLITNREEGIDVKVDDIDNVPIDESLNITTAMLNDDDYEDDNAPDNIEKASTSSPSNLSGGNTLDLPTVKSNKNGTSSFNSRNIDSNGNDARSSSNANKNRGKKDPFQKEKSVRQRWSKDEVKVIEGNFDHCLKNRILPSKEEIEGALKKHGDIFKNRNYKNMKTKIRSMFLKK